MEKSLVKTDNLGEGRNLAQCFLDDQVAIEITTLHGEIAVCLKMSLEKAIRIGELLKIQKEKLGHGNFTHWTLQNLPFSDRTARNYMNVFENRETLKTETVSVLTGAYKLLSAGHSNNGCERPIDTYSAAIEASLLVHGTDIDDPFYHDRFTVMLTLARICLSELESYFNDLDSLNNPLKEITEFCWLDRVSLSLGQHIAIERLRCEARLGKAIKEFMEYAQATEWIKNVGVDALLDFILAQPEMAIELIKKRIAELKAVPA